MGRGSQANTTHLISCFVTGHHNHEIAYIIHANVRQRLVGRAASDRLLNPPGHIAHGMRKVSECDVEEAIRYIRALAHGAHLSARILLCQVINDPCHEPLSDISGIFYCHGEEMQDWYDWYMIEYKAISLRE